MSKVIIKKKHSLYDAVKRIGTKATTDKGTYYFLPYWFKESGTHDLEVVPFNELPEEIKEQLLKARNDANNGEQTYSETDPGTTERAYPVTSHEAISGEGDSGGAES